MSLRMALSAVFLTAGIGVAVLAAQHAGQHQAPSHASRTDHAMCGSHHDGAAGLATQLSLTSEQSRDIEKIAADACAAMNKYHEQILAVLTADQRAKLMELHGKDAAASPLSLFFSKLHGGK